MNETTPGPDYIAEMSQLVREAAKTIVKLLPRTDAMAMFTPGMLHKPEEYDVKKTVANEALKKLTDVGTVL